MASPRFSLTTGGCSPGSLDALVDEALRPLRVVTRKRREVRALLDARFSEVLGEPDRPTLR
jgi:hypothetical protein